jgi:RNA polymerase sigma-70 factor (ECF subfamily)
VSDGRADEADELDRLAMAAAAGDAAALDRLVRIVAERVRARCQRILPNPWDAEEAAQEVLIVLVRRIGSFEGRSRFTTWLYQVTSGVALDTYRKLKRRSAEVGGDLPVVIADARTSVIAGARVDLYDALERVDARYAEAVVLRDLCQLDYPEIAAALDVPTGTVKSRIHEGRRQLQHLLDEQHL